VVGSKTALEMI